MISDIIKLKHKLNFGQSGAYLRYDMRSLVWLGEHDINFMDCTELCKSDVYCLFYAGLLCYFEECGISDSIEYAKEIYLHTSETDITFNIYNAKLLALPSKRYSGKRGKKGIDYKSLRGIYDVMGKTDEEFLSSTIREIIERWDEYAVIKGIQKPATEVKKVYSRD